MYEFLKKAVPIAIIVMMPMLFFGGETIGFYIPFFLLFLVFFYLAHLVVVKYFDETSVALKAILYFGLMLFFSFILSMFASFL